MKRKTNKQREIGKLVAKDGLGRNELRDLETTERETATS